MHQVAIVGAGFAGIITALHLKKSGRTDFLIFEKANAVGGTWRDNVYPGCACDVPTPLYSIADEPNPNWSRFFAPQSEILQYLKDIVKKHDLEQYIRYDSDIIQCIFDENGGFWTLTDRKGRSTQAKVMIGAQGPLNRIALPNIAGRERFLGKMMHSADWDTAYDLRGKRVAVIGTGASSVQIVPVIAPEVADLTVFQRRAAWVSDRKDKPISEEKKILFKEKPQELAKLRRIIYWFLEVRGWLFTGNRLVYWLMQRQCLRKLKTEVHDAALRQKLTPDYNIGCKRLLSTDDYLPTFNRENVHLETEKIQEITADSIITANGKTHTIDVIIYCTGFDAAEIKHDRQIFGRQNRELYSEWQAASIQGFRGTTISGFPNMLTVLGPNTGTGHTSVLLNMESQMPYILQYLDKLDSLSANAFLDVKPQAQANYNQNLQAKFAGTVWTGDCGAWYKDSKGVNTTLYPRLIGAFRKEVARFDASEYEIFGFNDK
jgi:cation diffusion facilitator CzcD-associated flavoprotein CzcO